jgi:uncharacterized protein DUF4145
MSTTSQANMIRSHCNQCGGRTSHDLLHSQSVDHVYGSGEDLEFVTRNEFQLLRCRGCEWVSMRHTEWFGGAGSESRVGHYPPLISRKKAQWIFQSWASGTIPGVTHSLLDEIYRALHTGSHRLAAMGVRSLIENVMIEKVGDHGGFTRNLSAFHSQAWISQKQQETLARIIDAGHAVTHRNFVPSVEDLNTLMDIAEVLIAGIYVHPPNGVALSNKVPRRQPRPQWKAGPSSPCKEGSAIGSSKRRLG